ncbi:MAG TPA: succinate dehydrogenase cytochrome b subunit [Planctomycetaceae bacterium]|nr:succinate dehydrogenase cytochrome b subunit [Planctomycetaceae bacterium]
MSWLVFAVESSGQPREWLGYLIMLLAAGALAALSVKRVISSVARKYVMAVTGLFWCLFLVGHLGGNLLMYVGAEAYNAYAHTLHGQEWLVKSSEFGLLYLLLLHIALALGLSKDNAAARGAVSYREAHTKRGDRLAHAVVKPDYWMLVTGLAVLAFLVLHWFDFVLHLRTDIEYEGREPFDVARSILASGPTIVGYTVGVILLGFHIGHGFQSAFQSLGINHPRFNRGIRRFGIGFAWVITLGFLSFPWVVGLAMRSN